MWFSNLSDRPYGGSLAALLLLLLVSACGGGGGGGSAGVSGNSGRVPNELNVQEITVDAGPPGSGYNVNRLYTSVTLCTPGSTAQCQTIDHILLDTGSTGLRLLASAIGNNLHLQRVTSANGAPLLGCAKFVDNSFVWGGIANADLSLAGLKAANVPIQVIADPAFNPFASTCSTGKPLETAIALGANGILGLGLLRQDCGPGCVSNANNGIYFTCTTPACSDPNPVIPSAATLAQQVTHPVPQFSTDNNGLLIDLPAVNATTAAFLRGSLIFGIGTRANNTMAAQTPQLLSGGSYSIATAYGGKIYSTSYIDTGSNGYFFGAPGTFTDCGSGINGFYCPANTTALAASLIDVNGATLAVPFSISNAATLFSSNNPVLPNLSGSLGDTSAFVWGLPFFYGRRVYFGMAGIDGSTPYFAFETARN